MFLRHLAPIVIGDYPFADELKKDIVPLLEKYPDQMNKTTNVKATHTEWNWGLKEESGIQIKKFGKYILNEIQKQVGINLKGVGEEPPPLIMTNFWANVYEKGDHAISHHHDPYKFSFAYFVKSKWYHSPLIFTESGKRIRPKEGRYVIFPSYIWHHVPTHRFHDQRITLSGNLGVQIILQGMKFNELSLV